MVVLQQLTCLVSLSSREFPVAQGCGDDPELPLHRADPSDELSREPAVHGRGELRPRTGGRSTLLGDEPLPDSIMCGGRLWWSTRARRSSRWSCSSFASRVWRTLRELREMVSESSALIRAVAHGFADAETATEIQNVQIGWGDVCRQMAIPIYMIFPRLFTCPTMLAPSASALLLSSLPCVHVLVPSI